MQLTRVFFSTGSRDRQKPPAQCPDTLEAWLRDLVWSKTSAKLPAPWLGYSAKAQDHFGGLVVTISNSEYLDPLLTVGIARRANHGRPLWSIITAMAMAPTDKCPDTPWCGVLEHSAGSAMALDSFITECAWLWATVFRTTRKPRSRPEVTVSACGQKLQAIDETGFEDNPSMLLHENSMAQSTPFKDSHSS